MRSQDVFDLELLDQKIMDHKYDPLEDDLLVYDDKDEQPTMHTDILAHRTLMIENKLFLITP